MTVKALPIVLLALAPCALSFGLARADEDTPAYTIQDVTACSGDAMRLCKDKLPHIDAIEDCMKAHYEDLKPKCKARFKNR